MRSSRVSAYQLLLLSVVRLQRQQVVLPPPPEERLVLLPLVRFEVGQYFVVAVVVGLVHLLQLEQLGVVFPAHPPQIVPSATDFDVQARYRPVRPSLAAQHVLRQTPDVSPDVCLVRLVATGCSRPTISVEILSVSMTLALSSCREKYLHSPRSMREIG